MTGHKSWRVARALVLGAIALGLSGLPARTATAADEKQDGNEGKPWILDSNNWQQGEGLLPDVVLKRVKEGQYWYKVVPVDPEKFKQNYSKNFWAASEANAGKYDIDPDTGGLKEKGGGARPTALFGLPFPAVDPGDPLAGPKILHNYRVRQMQADGAMHHFSLADVTRDGEVLRSVQIFLSYRFYLGTTSAAPKALPDNTEWRQLAAATEPKDVEGVGVLTWRFNDWKTWDQVWAYMPSIRRVRRVRLPARWARCAAPAQGRSSYFDGRMSWYAFG